MALAAVGRRMTSGEDGGVFFGWRVVAAAFGLAVGVGFVRDHRSFPLRRGGYREPGQALPPIWGTGRDEGRA